MKNPENNPIREKFGISKKLILIMKLTTIILFVGAIHLSATGYSQKTKISLSLKETSIKEVFTRIEEETDFRFFYNENFTDLNRAVDLEAENDRVETILDNLFASSEITYKVLENNLIVITPRNLLQQQRITGKVTDASNGEVLPGVNVVVRGTSIGAITNEQGIYTLDIPTQSTAIEFSFIGYNSQVVAYTGQAQVDVALVQNTTLLEEIVVVGYGTQTKRTVTGSIQTISADELKDIPVSQVTQSLQGKVTGVQINQRTGTPGAAMSVRIRGAGSINAGSNPLYVIDGFPIDGDLTGINPEEIESITILKDASSTALYGSRAANGVVMVETKSGKTGKTQINLSAYGGFQALPQKGRVEMMNGQEFAQFKKETYEDRNVPVPALFQNPEEYGGGTDWYGLMFRTAPMQDYTLTFQSGNEKFRNSVVAGYFNQEGIMLNSGYNRYSLRINSEYTVNKVIGMGFNIAPSYSQDHSPSTGNAFWAGNLLYNALLAWPIMKYKNDDGTLPLAYNPGSGSFPTPNYYRAVKEIKNDNEDVRMLSNAYVTVKPIKGLTLKSTINLQINNGNFEQWNPSTSTSGFNAAPPITAFSVLRNTRSRSWANENTATYDMNLGDHKLSFLAGFTNQKFIQKRMSIRGEQFPDDRIPDIDAAVNLVLNGTDAAVEEWSLLSYLGRANYSYGGKYNFSAVIRRDGSSRFGSDNRWGLFPSISGSWIVSDENFFPENRIVSLAKVRASWGVTGNNNIGNYTQYALVNLDQNAVFGSNIASGSRVANLANTELGWETSNQIDLGLDLGFLKNRITFAYDYYNKVTTNLLYNLEIPRSSGYSNFMGNSGEFKFWGHEFSIESKNMIGKFNWTTNLQMTFSDNEVVSLAENITQVYGGATGSRTITRVGQRIGLFWGMIQDGVYDDAEEYASSPKAAASGIGTVKFVDMNGDGSIDNSDILDRTVIGDPTPKFLFGFTNSFNYRNFDLALVVSGSYGNDIANGFDQGTTNLDGVFNVKKEIKDRWRSPENPGSGKYGTTNFGTGNERDWFHSRFIEDGSYLTIKNVTLGYNFKKIKIVSSLRVYASVQQLYTFTNYSGNNPEVSDNNTSILSLGVDNALYPIPRTFAFGVNIGF